MSRRSRARHCNASGTTHGNRQGLNHVRELCYTGFESTLDAADSLVHKCPEPTLDAADTRVHVGHDVSHHVT